MVKLGLFVLIVALLLYLALKDESKEPAPQSITKVQTEQTAQEEPEKTDEQKGSRTQEKFKKEEAVIIDTEEDEADERIAEDERAEDYYKKSDTLPQGNLVGGAEVEWIEPDKSEKPKGKFGLPPPTF